jgi:hypothetical protein
MTFQVGNGSRKLCILIFLLPLRNSEIKIRMQQFSSLCLSRERNPIDLYLLGITFHEMLTGVLAFRASDPNYMIGISGELSVTDAIEFFEGDPAFGALSQRHYEALEKAWHSLFARCAGIPPS